MNTFHDFVNNFMAWHGFMNKVFTKLWTFMLLFMAWKCTLEQVVVHDFMGHCSWKREQFFFRVADNTFHEPFRADFPSKCTQSCDFTWDLNDYIQFKLSVRQVYMRFISSVSCKVTFLLLCTVDIMTYKKKEFSLLQFFCLTEIVC